MASIILAILLASLSFLLVSTVAKPKFIYLLHFLLLLATPLLIILILGKPSLRPPTPNKAVCNQTSSNASCLTSVEFLFFQGESRKLYGIKDHGVFLPSFIPAFFIGLWTIITSKNNRHIFIALIMIICLGLTALMSKDGGLLSVLWSVVPISVLATLGFHKMLSLFLSKRVAFVFKVFVLMNFGLLVYETARLYQIIIFHKPFA